MASMPVAPRLLAPLVACAALGACSGDESNAPVNAGPSEATEATVTVAAAAPSPTTTPASAGVTTALPSTTVAAPPSSAPIAAPSPAGEYALAVPPVLPEHSALPPTGDAFPD